MGLRSSCDTEYIEIVDSNGGNTTRLCGTKRLLEPLTTPPLYSFKLTFKTANTDPRPHFYKGWKCHFACLELSHSSHDLSMIPEKIEKIIYYLLPIAIEHLLRSTIYDQTLIKNCI